MTDLKYQSVIQTPTAESLRFISPKLFLNIYFLAQYSENDLLPINFGGSCIFFFIEQTEDASPEVKGFQKRNYQKFWQLTLQS